MKSLIILFVLVSPLVAQTRSELDSKYGPIQGGRYRIQSGVAVEATFSDNGKVRTLRIIPDDSGDKNSLLRIEDVRKVSRELVGNRLCHFPLKSTEIKVPCPPRTGCRGVQEEWKRAETLVVWFKELVVYATITLADDSVPAPGNIKLLPGYEHIPSCGIDTAGGYIKKVGGVELHYDIGHMAGNFARRYSNSYNAEWTRTERVGDDTVLIVLTKQNRIVATFEKAVANFTANVISQDNIDDFLKMILTYNAPN